MDSPGERETTPDVADEQNDNLLNDPYADFPITMIDRIDDYMDRRLSPSLWLPHVVTPQSSETSDHIVYRYPVASEPTEAIDNLTNVASIASSPTKQVSDELVAVTPENEVQPSEGCSHSSTRTDSEDVNEDDTREFRIPQPDSVEEGSTSTSCSCRKSKCCKLYCKCFAASVYCAEHCKCRHCFNKPANYGY